MLLKQYLGYLRNHGSYKESITIGKQSHSTKELRSKMSNLKSFQELH